MERIDSRSISSPSCGRVRGSIIKFCFNPLDRIGRAGVFHPHTGASRLFFGLLSDRIGRRLILFGFALEFIVLTGLTATARSAEQLILWRCMRPWAREGWCRWLSR